MQRDILIDKAKAIGITLIVLGHTPGVPPSLLNFIYAFHVPLFFFLAGAVISSSKISSSPTAMLRKIGAELLVPYIFFGTLSAIAWLISIELGARNFSMQENSWLYGLARGDVSHLGFNSVLWFFPALMVCKFCYLTLRKNLSNAAILILSSFCFFGILWNTQLHDHPMVWGVHALPASLWFVTLGNLWQDLERRLTAPPPKLSIAISGAGLIVTAILAQENGWVNLARGVYGQHAWLYPINATVGIGAVLLFCKVAHLNNRWANKIAAETIGIFPVHTLVFGLLTATGQKIFGLASGFQVQSMWVTPIYFVLGLCLSFAFSTLLHRHFPTALGRR